MRQLRLLLLCGAMAASHLAHAAFIDKRSDSAPEEVPASAVPVAATVTSVSGFSQSAGWGKPAPEAKGTPKLRDAIFLLLPEGHPAILLDGPGELLDTKVSWKAGSTRQEALLQAAAGANVNILFTGDKPGSKVVVSKLAAPAAPSTTTAAAQPAAAAKPAAAAAPAAPAAAVASATPGLVKPAPVQQSDGMKTFEVRLADVTLNKTLQRWAADNGVRVRWDADKQLLIGAPDVLRARNVLEAIDQIFMTPGIRNSEYPLEACEYPNQPPLIRVTRQGEQAKDCPGK